MQEKKFPYPNGTVDKAPSETVEKVYFILRGPGGRVKIFCLASMKIGLSHFFTLKNIKEFLQFSPEKVSFSSFIIKLSYYKPLLSVFVSCQSVAIFYFFSFWMIPASTQKISLCRVKKKNLPSGESIGQFSLCSVLILFPIFLGVVQLFFLSRKLMYKSPWPKLSGRLTEKII